MHNHTASVIRAFVCLSLLVVWASPADADFDQTAQDATVVRGDKAMSALFWSLGTPCKSVKDELLRRQCEGIAAARKMRIGSSTFLVEVDSRAMQAVATDTGVKLSLRACLQCESEGPVVIGKGKHKVEGGNVIAPELANTLHRLSSGPEASHYAKHTATRLRAQVLFKVPSKLERFSVGDRDGFKVQISGYRIFDPCVGQALAAKPASSVAPRREGSCDATPVFVAKDEGPQKPVETRVAQLTPQLVKNSMQPLHERARVCHKAYGIDGRASFKLVITGEGSLGMVKQSGDFTGTPTGICLKEAMDKVVFPKSKKKKTTISYPLVLSQ